MCCSRVSTSLAVRSVFKMQTTKIRVSPDSQKVKQAKGTVSVQVTDPCEAKNFLVQLKYRLVCALVTFFVDRYLTKPRFLLPPNFTKCLSCA